MTRRSLFAVLGALPFVRKAKARSLNLADYPLPRNVSIKPIVDPKVWAQHLELVRMLDKARELHGAVFFENGRLVPYRLPEPTINVFDPSTFGDPCTPQQSGLLVFPSEPAARAASDALGLSPSQLATDLKKVNYRS